MSYDYRADPILGGTLAYWLRKRGGRAMPCKRDIDPVDMPPRLLPHLQIIEVVDGGARFRYRIVGTAIVEAMGREYTGKCPDELFPGPRGQFIYGVYRAACAARRPIFSYSRYTTAKGFDLAANRVYLPLSGDGLDVDFLLAALTFDGIAAIDGRWGDGAMLIPAAQRIEEIDLSIPVAA